VIDIWFICIFYKGERNTKNGIEREKGKNVLKNNEYMMLLTIVFTIFMKGGMMEM
jgi:hypothetical protein